MVEALIIRRKVLGSTRCVSKKMLVRYIPCGNHVVLLHIPREQQAILSLSVHDRFCALDQEVQPVTYVFSSEGLNNSNQNT